MNEEMVQVATILTTQWEEVKNLPSWSGTASFALPDPRMHVVYQARLLCGLYQEMRLENFLNLLREEQLHIQNEHISTREWQERCIDSYQNLITFLTIRIVRIEGGY